MPKSQSLCSRRGFLRTGAQAAATTGLAITLGAAATTGPKQGDTEHTAGPEHGSGFAKLVDASTAGVVVGSFMNNVVWDGVCREKPLGPRSAFKMTSLALGRTGALYLLGDAPLGGHHTAAELAKHEREELAHDVIPIPFLIAVSDMPMALRWMPRSCTVTWMAARRWI